MMNCMACAGAGIYPGNVESFQFSFTRGEIVKTAVLPAPASHLYSPGGIDSC